MPYINGNEVLGAISTVISDGSITTSKLADGAVTIDKLADEVQKLIVKENLVLLKEFTVTDTGETPLSVYNFTTDDNGNAFNLKSCRVVLYVPSGQNQGGTVAFSPNISATNSIGRFSISNIRQASTHSLFYFDLHAEQGFYVINGYGTSVTYLANTMPKTLTVDTSRILSVYFQTNQTNYGFPVGTIFRIYGVQDNVN